MFERIIIIGCSGAGKSTLSKQLAEILNLPLYHLDKIFWTQDHQSINKEAFDERLNSILTKDKWIIDGNYNRTLPIRLNRCDTVIWLDYPTLTCLLGVIKRKRQYPCGGRTDMPPDFVDKLDKEFLSWIVSFRTKYRRKYYSMLSVLPNKTILISKSRRQTKKLLKYFEQQSLKS